MRKEVRQLRAKAINSLIMSIDHFNRPWDRGRSEAVLILLDHSFEMLLKAAIVQRKGRIRRAHETETIGFDACVRKALTDAKVKFLTDEQVLTLRAINGQRDAAQHYFIDISEHQLYLYAQAGVTLFRDIHDSVFDKRLVLELPARVLPVSTTVPKDLAALFDTEVNEIKDLLAPGTRKRMDAVAKARSLAVLEGAVQGHYEQPSDHELTRICNRLSAGEEWPSVFPGVAFVNLAGGVDGTVISLRFTKNEGPPVQVLKEGDAVGAVLGVRRVNELDFYSLGANQLAKKVGLTPPKARAVVDHLGLRKNAECFKEIRIGASRYPRYSPKAIRHIRTVLRSTSIDEIWAARKRKRAEAE